MHAIIFADRDGQELWPLTARRPVALLPIGNKPLLQITLEELYEIGIRSAVVVSRYFADLVETHFGNGEKFGFQLNHLAVNDQLSIAEVLRMVGLQHDADWIAVRGDMLRPMGFLQNALGRRDEIAAADIFVAMGIALPDKKLPFGHDISWPEVCRHCNLHPCLVDSLSTYHSANIMALRGLVPGIRMPGRPLPDKTIVGAGSQVQCRRAPNPMVNIGERCRIFDNTEIGENTIIGHGSIIDRGSATRNAVVLPGTYVGSNLTIEDAIVDGGLVICSKTGAIAELFHPALFGHVGSN